MCTEWFSIPIISTQVVFVTSQWGERLFLLKRLIKTAGQRKNKGITVVWFLKKVISLELLSYKSNITYERLTIFNLRCMSTKHIHSHLNPSLNNPQKSNGFKTEATLNNRKYSSVSPRVSLPWTFSIHVMFHILYKRKPIFWLNKEIAQRRNLVVTISSERVAPIK